MSEGAEEPPTSAVMPGSSTYSQVVFNNVGQAYPPDSAVKCEYTVTTQFKPNRRDWLGIFRVGWSTTRDYYTFVWVAPPADSEGEALKEQQVVFQGPCLTRHTQTHPDTCRIPQAAVPQPALLCPRRPCSAPASPALPQPCPTVAHTRGHGAPTEGVMRLAQHLGGAMRLAQHLCTAMRLAQHLGGVMRLAQHLCTAMRLVCKCHVKQKLKEYTSTGSGFTLEKMGKKVQELQQSVKTLQEKYERALAKIAEQRQEKDELRGRTEEQEAEIARLKNKLRELDQELKRAREELRSQEDRVQLLQVDLQSSQKEAVKLAGELRAARAAAEEGERLRSEVHVLRRSLSEKEEMGDSASEQSEALSRRLQELTGQLAVEKQRAGQQCEELKRAGERLRVELTESQEQLKYWTRGYEKIKEMNSKVEIQLMEARQSLEEQASQTQFLTMEKEELAEEKKALVSRLERLQEEIAHLQRSPASITLQHPNPYVLPAPIATVPANPDLTGEVEWSDDVLSVSVWPVSQDEVKLCQYCQEQFPGISQEELEEHEQSHKVCPFCSLICDALEQQEFEDHVYAHEE
uniref:SKICH domain-containing protein n=1 Tax=Lepisosteus oculatus TaxID=7918 RepID=W5N7L1_LEPOC